MKSRSLISRLSAAVALLLCAGITSCEKEHNDREPYYVLWFVAHVVDEAGEPVQGILAYPEGDSFDGRSGYSDYTGSISGFAHLSPYISGDIIFEDVDGEYNGGIYESVTINIRDKMYGANNKPDEWGFTGSDVVDVGNVVMTKRK